jgi:FlaG/FlaF family flagellin (archaellin)
MHAALEQIVAHLQGVDGNNSDSDFTINFEEDCGGEDET